MVSQSSSTLIEPLQVTWAGLRATRSPSGRSDASAAITSWFAEGDVFRVPVQPLVAVVARVAVGGVGPQGAVGFDEVEVDDDEAHLLPRGADAALEGEGGQGRHAPRASAVSQTSR